MIDFSNFARLLKPVSNSVIVSSSYSGGWLEGVLLISAEEIILVPESVRVDDFFKHYGLQFQLKVLNSRDWGFIIGGKLGRKEYSELSSLTAFKDAPDASFSINEAQYLYRRFDSNPSESHHNFCVNEERRFQVYAPHEIGILMPRLHEMLATLDLNQDEIQLLKQDAFKHLQLEGLISLQC